MHSRLIILFLLYGLLHPRIVAAQLEADNWVYDFTINSNSGGFVSFNKANSPVQMYFPTNRDNVSGGESGTASYSDKNGNLLFSVLGLSVYDKNFKKMPGANPANGTFIKGARQGSLSQPLMCISYPGHDSMYIVFHIYFDVVNNYQSPLFYTVINMKLRNGLGDIEQGQLNVPLLNGQNVAYKLTAVKHCNNRDIWLVGHLVNSDQYFSFLITPAGVAQTPVYFSGSLIPLMPLFNNITKPNNHGCMKVSPSGDKLAAAMMGPNFVELFDFNNATGVGSNLKTLHIHFNPRDTATTDYGLLQWHRGVWGIEFSPSGNRLYVSGNYELVLTAGDTLITPMVHQFDVSLPTQALIQNSQYEVARIPRQGDGGALQLADNGKIYFNLNGSLAEISSPENPGAACNFSGVVIRTSLLYNLNLPGYVQSFFRYPLIINNNCSSRNLSFSLGSIAGITNVHWNFGDPASGAANETNGYNANHLFTNNGIYKITAIVSSNSCVPDTIVKYVNAGQFKVNLGNDTSYCTGDSVELRINIPGAIANWDDSVPGTSRFIKQPGRYSVKVYFGDCSAADTIQVFERTPSQFSLGKDTSICLNSSLTLTPSPLTNNASYQWSTNANTSQLTISQTGEYWLKVTNQFGCSWRDTIEVGVKSLPSFTIGNDTSICAKDTLTITASENNVTSYLWSNNLVANQIKGYQQGWYWCEILKDGCRYRDSMQLTVKPLPVVRLGTDTTLCEGIKLKLSANNINSTYVWQDNSAADSFIVETNGLYYVTVNKEGCVASDTINIRYKEKPKFNLGVNQLICNGQQVVLKPVVDTSWQLLWQNGSDNSSYLVVQPGAYSLQATNECGITKKEVVFSEGLCNVYIPTAFTPNGDSRNDLFKISGTDLMTYFHLQVYNRYGQLVFETNDKNKVWDGQFGNKPQETGAYVYRLEYKDNQTKAMKSLRGSILLLR